MKKERGTEATLYVNFLTLENKEATTVVNPKITIRHINENDVLVTDINEAVLTLATETLYYYKWSIPSDAYLGDYTIEYQAIVDGEYAEGNDGIEVIPTGESSSGVTGGLYTTKAKVAAYFGVAISKIEDDWIEWASRYIDLYTNRVFYEIEIIDEKYDIDQRGQSILFLDNFPVTSVTKVKNDETTMDSTEYLVYNGEGIIKLADDFTGNIYNIGAFVYGRQKVLVSYKYGCVNIPKELQWAATVLTDQIAYASLVQSGDISAGALIEEEIGEYRRKREDTETSQNYSNITERSKLVAGKLEEDVFSAKNVLRIYRIRKMRAV